MQLVIFRAYHNTNSSLASINYFEDNNIHYVCKSYKNNLQTISWCFNPEKIEKCGKMFFIPCSIFQHHNQLSFQQSDEIPLNTNNMYASLQNIFDIHCDRKTYGAEDQHVFQAHLLYIISMVCACGYLKMEKDTIVSNFIDAFTFFQTLINIHDQRYTQIANLINSALNKAKEYMKDNGINQDIILEARRKLTLSGLSNMIILAKDHVNMYFDASILSVETQQQNLRETYNTICNFCESNSNALNMICHIFLLGDRCIQDCLDINFTESEQTTCCECGQTCKTLNITTNNSTICRKCKRILCSNCSHCNCSQFICSMACSEKLFLNWEHLKRNESILEDIQKMKKQNKTLCETNVKLALMNKNLQFEEAQIRKELKENKCLVKKEKIRIGNEHNASQNELREEIKHIQEEKKMLEQNTNTMLTQLQKTQTQLVDLQRKFDSANLNARNKKQEYDRIVTEQNREMNILKHKKTESDHSNKELQTECDFAKRNVNRISVEKDLEMSLLVRELTFMDAEEIDKEKNIENKFVDSCVQTKDAQTWTVKPLTSEASTMTDDRFDDGSVSSFHSVDSDIQSRITRLEEELQQHRCLSNGVQHFNPHDSMYLQPQTHYLQHSMQPQFQAHMQPHFQTHMQPHFQAHMHSPVQQNHMQPHMSTI